MNNIIEIILKDNAAEKAAEHIKVKTITSDNFFIEDSPDGLFHKREFLTFLKPFDQNDLKALDHTLKLMHDDKNFECTPFQKLDSKGRDYVWIIERLKKTSGGYKLLSNDTLCLFLNMYGMELVKFKLTLAELYTRATS